MGLGNLEARRKERERERARFSEQSFKIELSVFSLLFRTCRDAAPSGSSQRCQVTAFSLGFHLSCSSTKGHLAEQTESASNFCLFVSKKF